MVKRGASRPTVPGHMPPVIGGEQQLRQILNIALGRVTNRPERREVVDRALDKAGISGVPASAGALAAFVFGAFRDATDELLGSEVATVVTHSLLPMLTQHAARDPHVEEAQETCKAVGTEAEIPTVDGPLVVLADGEPNSRAQSSAQLRSVGHDVVSVPDAHVALAVCIRRRPAVVVAAASAGAVDVQQLAGLLQVAFGDAAPPVVAVVDDGAADAGDLGAAIVVHRPVDKDVLFEAIRSVLASSTAGE